MNEKMEEKIENDYHGFFLGNNIKEPVGNLNERWTDVPADVWQKPIHDAWRHLLFSGMPDAGSPLFLDKIWEASVEVLGGLEVSVIVDANDRLFMNSGSPGLVDYGGVMVSGMKLPLKSWIHTHPFGVAFWSGTDRRTLRTWRPILNQAIVLGGEERLIWEKKQGREVMTKIVETDKFPLN
ncbi:MAG: hypothetical protein CL605_02260 [Altibacter sp.]|nr:hypothetical protein [Altibacter sp.]|tara:strand:+ start:397 stop:939 length:543 start_codon:yes stop_codon:yes gene_type:complete